MKREAGFENKKDGAFFMSFGAYKKKFHYSWINYDTSSWARASFLMLNDTTSTPGTPDYCGTHCTRHEFTLTSSID